MRELLYLARIFLSHKAAQPVICIKGRAVVLLSKEAEE
jgi:hypothetical protein